MQRGYGRGLVWVLEHQPLTLAVTVALAVLTGWLYAAIPKGLFPQQDTGFVFVTVEGRQDISFAAMVDRQNEVTAVLLRDPAVESVAAFAGTGAIVPSENLARLFLQLKPRSQRDVSADQFIQRMRPEVAEVQDVNVYMQVGQDLTFGGRVSRTQYQYTLLGTLYESYIHPITILSALPSAGVGALLALMAFGYDLSMIALIGIILLIGIVKKNAIMMIDFAIKAERDQGMSPREAIRQACLLRFRPITMTTLAAAARRRPAAGARDQGAGSELRRPLGVAIVGGLIVSARWLTLYTTSLIATIKPARRCSAG